MEDRTYLDTRDGMATYAQRYGAKRDELGWYVEGEIPPELLGLVPKKPNKSAYIQSPSCPKCGASMVLRSGKSGDFWGCSQYRNRGCKGYVSYDEHLEALEGGRPAKRVGDFLRNPECEPPQSPTTHSTTPALLQQEIRRVITLAVEIRGNEARAQEWLTKPKVGLDSRIPFDVMRTGIEGCRQVAALLEVTRE